MKRIKKITAILLLALCLLFATSCGDEETSPEEELTIEEISDWLNILDDQDRIDLEETQRNEERYWTDDINEELERFGKAALEGAVLTVYHTDDETYILEFESAADAEAAMQPLAYWENESRYKEFKLSRVGKLVLFGEKSTVDLILEAPDKKETASGSDDTASGLLYELQDNRYYAVAGIGSCKASVIAIPEEYNGLPVCEIKSRAFQSCETITEVTVPKSIVIIREKAFYNCKNLKKITLSDSLTTIEKYTFSGTALENVTLPKSVSTIGTCAFLGCQQLTRVTIQGNNTVRIPNSCFSSCKNLKSVILPNGLQEIEAGAFSNCTSLTEIHLPESLQILNGFQGCSALQSITIPKNVTSVHAFTFKECDDLEVIYNKTGKNLSYLLEYTNSQCRIVSN